MDENRIIRVIPCTDASGRARTLQVIGAPGSLTFVAPPGGSASIEPRHYELLHRAQLEALSVAWQEPRPPQP